MDTFRRAVELDREQPLCLPHARLLPDDTRRHARRGASRPPLGGSRARRRQEPDACSPPSATASAARARRSPTSRPPSPPIPCPASPITTSPCLCSARQPPRRRARNYYQQALERGAVPDPETRGKTRQRSEIRPLHALAADPAPGLLRLGFRSKQAQPPRPPNAKPLSQRLNENNGYKQDADGNWVPKSDKRSSFESQGKSPYFTGRIRQKNLQDRRLTRKNPGGETRTTAASHTPETPMAAASRKSSRSMAKAPAKPAPPPPSAAPYQTDNYATSAAREAGNTGLAKPSDTETDIRRRVFPAARNHRLAANNAPSVWTSRRGFWAADRLRHPPPPRQRFQQQFFQGFPAPRPAFEEKCLGHRKPDLGILIRRKLPRQNPSARALTPNSGKCRDIQSVADAAGAATPPRFSPPAPRLPAFPTAPARPSPHRCGSSHAAPPHDAANPRAIRWLSCVR